MLSKSQTQIPPEEAPMPGSPAPIEIPPRPGESIPGAPEVPPLDEPPENLPAARRF